MRTISLRLPIAHALLSNGAGIIGKGHCFDDKRFGLQCSTQGGANTNLRSELVLAGLLPGLLRDVEPPPMGHVFASARVLSRVAAMNTCLQTTDALYKVAPAHLSRAHVQRWFKLQPDALHYYVLVDVQPCRPAKWRGVMSCFPVPDEVFQ